ncbi:hypothetical protein FF125_10510 [Aureibaculum algae]|uniref:Uncharacterized protein n=1 Tax=Aureibaculum algae TaxID=2584122 RepID=A0A5B7TPZ8_9FLAO|nr:hypothetical protein [Aureibaculum algae]QCX38845.1 hypothetical protein FF125_10510 [Aureibaculum algae]
MNRYIYFIVILLISILNCYSQNNIIWNNDGTAYIPLKMYRTIYHQDVLKEDFDKLKIKGNDTLVLVDNLIKKGNKIGVKRRVISERRTYMTLKSFKQHYKRPLTKVDSLSFKFNNNDTLVLVKDYKPRGVSVPYEKVDSTLLEIYKDVVYRKYHSKKSDKRKEYMVLWTEPIKLYFSESVDKEYEQVIRNLSMKISNEIDSLNISFVSNLEESNYVIYQIDENHSHKYSKNMSANKYINFHSYWNKGKIYDTKLEINTTTFKNAEVNKKYLMKSFIRSLGHFYTTSKVPCESVFSNCNGQKITFGETDLKLLKYHYSYGICKRTPLETFEENHEKAKQTFLQTGRPLYFIHVD